MSELEHQLEQVCTKMSCWAAAVMVPDTAQNVLVCKAGRNLPEDWATLTNPLDDSTLNGKAYMNNEVIIQNDLDQTTIRNAPTFHRIYGIMIVPIVRDGKVTGTLEFINDGQDIFFQEHELLLAQKCAKQIADLL